MLQSILRILRHGAMNESASNGVDKSVRRKTRAVSVKDIVIGGGAPVSVQSMTNVPIDNVAGTVSQINALAEKGASLVRLALLTVDSVQYLKEILKQTSVPLCADIHFDYRIALAAIDAGIHKLRINPGNIGSTERTREVVRSAMDHGVPIRIGVNGGSIDKKKYRVVTPEALVDSAMGHVKILEDLGFNDIIVSMKASDVRTTILANRLFASLTDYPVHLGLTEAGYGLASIVSSSAAIGSLLADGIGDTIRVSITGDPIQEIPAGYEILKALGLVHGGIRMIACPTCGRTDPEIKLEDIARRVETRLTADFGKRLTSLGRTLSVAVMGCEVNGPGEASHADIGIAGARSGQFLLFSRGQKIDKIKAEDVANALSALAEDILNEKK
jgi:(E)-4-hydroxy-3-methylbut-2-enyl-diphosphate synthase